MISHSTSQGLKYINSILNFINEWMQSKNIPSSNRIIFRGLSGIYDPYYIRSGAAIRLKFSSLNSSYDNTQQDYKPNYITTTDKDIEMPKIMVYKPKSNAKEETVGHSSFSYSDYISYHEHLIQNARLTEPNNYKNVSDLEVLADLQHYGAATCLVDFSRNMLTSLWFACREKSGKIKNPKDLYQGQYGILYCYDTHHDIIDRNNLTIVNSYEMNVPISSLLARTKKITNFCSNTEYTFMLWEPAHINSRIAKQDSIFLFGLSKFCINQHPIHSIIIHDDIKADIVKALDQIFNINANTIFHDKQGYVTINSKFDRLSLNHNLSGTFIDLFQHGLDDMFGGYYNIALDFFNAAERKLIEPYINDNRLKEITTFTGNVKFRIPKEMDALLMLNFAELFLSKAICYKHLVCNQNASAIDYKTNSLQEYLKAQIMFKNASEHFDDENKRAMYFRKYLRTTNDIIKMFYNLKQFDDCLTTCTCVINTIDNYHPASTTICYSSIFCKIARLELSILLLLTSPNNQKLEYYNKFNLLYNEIPKTNLTSESNNFNRLLISFFKYFIELYNDGLNEPIQNIPQKISKQTFNEFNRELSELYKMSPINNVIDYSAWDFTDLKKEIDANNFENKNKFELQKLLATIITARDYYRVLCLNNNNFD